MDSTTSGTVPQWGRFEQTLRSEVDYDNPLQDATLQATFTGPSGQTRRVDGFWDGDTTWRVRLMPDETGAWTYRTACSDPNNAALHDRSGTFVCAAASGATRFERHGPPRRSSDRRYLAHADGTPFFLLSDTAWAGPMRSTAEEWDVYLAERVRQRFTAAQWVTTQFVGAPDGTPDGELAYTGRERVVVNPGFFQRLDARLDALNRAGLLGIPVLLWAAEWSPPEVNNLNPGFALPEDQALLLARYMGARWGAHHVAWILNGDGDYRGPKAERWRRIGRALFAAEDAAPRAPVALHPAGMQWPVDEFRDEPWLDIVGYQSGHGDDERTLQWIVAGPPAADWHNPPPRPFVNLEPPYENHIAYHSKQPHSAHSVRRAIYWSLLNAPTAGVTYGGHGVWGWDDGSGPPANHPNTGTPLPWREALHMEAAEQMAHLVELFTSLAWWTLRPAPELLAHQPGETDPHHFITASRSEDGSRMVIYSPTRDAISLRASELGPGLRASWLDPRTGNRTPAQGQATDETFVFATPAPGDWLLVGERD